MALKNILFLSKRLDKKGLINLLPLAKLADIPKTIEFIRSHFNEGENASRFTTFWNYFTKVWLKTYDIKLWNISENTNAVSQRTNNALERYNRSLHANFSTPHPTMLIFVTTIRDEANLYVALYEDIKNGRKERIIHGHSEYIIPAAYLDFLASYEP